MTATQRMLIVSISLLALYAAVLTSCLGPIGDYAIRGVQVSTIKGKPRRDAMRAEMDRCLQVLAVETARLMSDVYKMEDTLYLIRWDDHPIPSKRAKLGWATGQYGNQTIHVLYAPHLRDTSYCHELGHHARWYWKMPFDPNHTDYAFWRDVR